MCNQHHPNIHDPSKLVNALKSSALLLETLLKNLGTGTQSSVKFFTGLRLIVFYRMNSAVGVFEDATQICGSFLKSLRPTYLPEKNYDYRIHEI